MSPEPIAENEAMSEQIAATLVSNHRKFLAFVERRVGDRAVAEDILQEAFVKSSGKLDDLPNDEAVVAWFYRVLRNSVIDYMRRRASSARKLESFAQELETELEPSTHPYDSPLRGAVCECVSELASTLKPEYADALQRIEIEGVPVKAYAEERGLSAGNAGVRVFRAREALRRRVARSCGTCAEHGCLDCTCSQKRG